MAFKIAVDAGHWYGEAGRRCLKSVDPSETREWTMNDRVADYFIEAAGKYEGVELLRIDDPTGKKEVSLPDRPSKANKWGADFYLSIHHNAGVGGGKGGGVVAFAYKNGGMAAKYRDAIYDAVISAGGIKGDRSDPKATANFAVLRQTTMPAVLIECGFMDSTTDIPIIIKKEYSKLVGYAMMEGVAKIAGLKKKEVKKVATVKKDNTPDKYAKTAVDWAVKNGILAGDGNGDYKLHSNVTRQDMLVFLHRALTK